MHAADLRFGNVDADINLIAFEKRGDGRVGGDQVAGAHVEHFDRSSGGGENLAFTEAGFIVSKRGFSGGDVFDAIAIFEFFERGLRLSIAGFRGGDLFGPIAAVQLIQFVPENSRVAPEPIFQLASAVSRCCLETRSFSASAS